MTTSKNHSTQARARRRLARRSAAPFVPDVSRRRSADTKLDALAGSDAAPRRRIHLKPKSRQVAACRPWLEAELAVLAPRLTIVILAHPSALLRIPDAESRAFARRDYVAQLRGVKRLIARARKSASAHEASPT
jgi:uracil-DNA glycosylase